MTSPCSLPPAALWEGGWYAYARRCPSPNFGARPANTPIDLLVMHSISLPPGEYGTPCVVDFFCNRLNWEAHPYFEQIRGMQVSAHFFIRRDGQLWQFVDCNERAWHAGKSSFRGRENCNDNSIGIEFEGLEGHCFEETQYETLFSLSSAILQRYPIASFVGHEHIAPGRKADPGAKFNWLRLSQALGADAAMFETR